MIPIARPSVGEEEARAASDVIMSGHLASGEEVILFEQEFVDYIGVSHGVATSNGTTALHAAMLALGIGPGDEVIVPSFTFIATATVVSMCGASPVVADVDACSYCIDPESVIEEITSKTKAILGVHLFGQPCEVKAILDICEDHRLLFVEDCAQAHGAQYQKKKVGSFGSAGCFSFYPTKNMTTGEGGFVTCDDREVARKVRLIINHGQQEKYLHTQIGYNFRLTNIGAAIGRVQLRKLDDMNLKRQTHGSYYTNHLRRKGILTPGIREHCTHVYHQYAIRVSPESGINRDMLSEYLNTRGIGTAVHYPIPIHEQPVFKGKISGSSCPVSKMISQEILSLPVYPDLTKDEQQSVIDAICD
ncbi:MAG: aminotransferase DegT [Methanomicrobiales archaeon HGW-Methanomicrobiales-4]|nr:MAG: aminotransferase DegT [Methanomicrobiales archaeon HGW-Methanomicrobiales-4]